MGIYQFQTEFYKDMPAEFQNAIDLTLTNCKNTYAYLDDIKKVTKVSKITQKSTENRLSKLDEENLTNPWTKVSWRANK